MNAVVSLLPTITPQSDQLNADDLIGKQMIITVTGVRLTGDAGEQPVAIHFEGDDGKPYKPCKSMRRVLVHVWGSDGNAYVGRRMALYRDEKVQFGGLAVGGIRISHMSNIDSPITMALTATRANRKPFTVQPLPAHAGAGVDLAAILAVGEEHARLGSVSLTAWWQKLSKAEKAAAKPALDEKLKPMAAKADQAALTDDILDDEPEPEIEAARAEGDANNAPSELPLAGADFDPIDWAASFTRGLDQLQTGQEVADAWSAAKAKGYALKLKAANPGMFEQMRKAVEDKHAEFGG